MLEPRSSTRICVDVLGRVRHTRNVADNEHDRRLRALARARGYRLTRTGTFVKTGFYVESDTLRRFKEATETLHYATRDAATEALEMWLEVHQSAIKSRKP